MNLRAVALLVALVLLGAGVFVGLAGGDDPLGEMSIEPLGGSVDVLRGNKVIKVTGAAELRAGDLIETGRGGARVRLEGQRNVWIDGSSRVLVIDTTTIEDRAGSVLVNAAEHTAVRVGEAVASSSNGVFRVDRGKATARAAAYRGDVMLVAPGNMRTRVPALYQSSIVAGDIEPPAPYQLGVNDVWDAQWLEDVVALEDELKRLSEGFSNQLKKARMTLADFRRLVGRPVVFMAPYVRNHAPADLFVGYAIARRVEAPPAPAFRAAFEKAFDLREDGGSWGVIATIMEVEPKPLVAALEKLFLNSGVIAGDATPGVLAVAPTDEPSPAQAGTPPASSTQPPDRRQEPPKEREKPKEKPKPPDDPPPDCEDTIDCVAQELPLPDVLQLNL